MIEDIFAKDLKYDNGKLKLLEAFKKLEFAINKLKEKPIDYEQLIHQQNNENISLKAEIARLKKENQYLHSKKLEAIQDVDYAIKVTEDILNKVKNEN